MRMRRDKERGFSLAELIVTLGILGVLAAISAVGYRGYIESSREAVTRANAKTLYRWFYDMQARRKTDTEIEPYQCSYGSGATAEVCITAVATYGPFRSITNPYSRGRPPWEVLRTYSPRTSWWQAAHHGREACPPGVIAGDLIVEIVPNAPVDTRYEVWYCLADLLGNLKIYTGHGWYVVW